jgi:hypothetical protein
MGESSAACAAPSRGTPTYEIVPYHPELLERVVRLQRHLWSPVETLNAAYFTWKHERNPYVGSPLVYLALHGRQVVGMRGMFGARWEHGPPRTTFLGLCADDMVIAPAHRERGLVSQIMRAALGDLARRGYGYIFNLTAGPATFMASLATGWRSTGSLKPVWRSEPRGIDLRRIRRALERIPLAWRYAESLGIVSSIQRRPFSRLDRNGARRRGGVSRHISLADQPRAEAMAALVERIGHDGRLRHVRDRAYFDWRFANPLCEYRFLFWDDVQLEGYLVLQTPAWPAPTRRSCRIMDWEASHEEVRAALLQAAIVWGQFPELVSWSATLPEGARRALDENRFAPVDGPPQSLPRVQPSVLVRPTRDEWLRDEWVVGTRRLLDLASWDLRRLYGM